MNGEEDPPKVRMSRMRPHATSEERLVDKAGKVQFIKVRKYREIEIEDQEHQQKMGKLTERLQAISSEQLLKHLAMSNRKRHEESQHHHSQERARVEGLIKSAGHLLKDPFAFPSISKQS